MKSTHLLHRILNQSGNKTLLDQLVSLPNSDLNSLLMEVFRQKAAQLTPSILQHHYETNRFVGPADLDVLSFMEFELALLKQANEWGFLPLELSPVSPLGACSAVATVHQDKIITALRGTEVTADATNLIALECAKRRKKGHFNEQIEQFCSIHRHVRTPLLKGALSFSHFKIFCLVSAGRAQPNYAFEYKYLLHHIQFYVSYLTNLQFFDALTIVLKNVSSNDTLYPRLCEWVERNLGNQVRLQREDSPQHYYQHIQFKIWVSKQGETYELADGGFVNWTQQLTNNRKERMMSSGLGIERLFKLLYG
ncbi:MAG: hypothetical protein U0Y10_20255 [Spirosomataceae bacterium]